MDVYPISHYAMEAAARKVGAVPVAFLPLDERPHDAPRDDTSNEERYNHHVWTDHSHPNVCSREIEVKPET